MAISKNADYDNTTAFGDGGFKSLPKGGYVCKIFKAEEKMSKNGAPMIHVAFDIAEGDYQGHFMELFKSRKDRAKDAFKEVKYPFEGQMWVMLNDYEDPTKTSRKFKGLCTALEDSGTQVWNGNQFNMDALNGAMVGVVYQNQEQEYQGNVSMRAVPWAFRSVDAIREGDFFVPDDKLLTLSEVASGIPGFQALEETEGPDIPF